MNGENVALDSTGIFLYNLDPGSVFSFLLVDHINTSMALNSIRSLVLIGLVEAVIPTYSQIEQITQRPEYVLIRNWPNEDRIFLREKSLYRERDNTIIFLNHLGREINVKSLSKDIPIPEKIEA